MRIKLKVVCICYEQSDVFLGEADVVSGGSLGWKTRGDLDPTFAEAAFGLEASTTGSPRFLEVKTKYGYHVVMVEGRK